jgi:hypothetical protein
MNFQPPVENGEPSTMWIKFRAHSISTADAGAVSD